MFEKGARPRPLLVSLALPGRIGYSRLGAKLFGACPGLKGTGSGSGVLRIARTMFTLACKGNDRAGSGSLQDHFELRVLNIAVPCVDGG